jgi:hypothetical protein
MSHLHHNFHRCATRIRVATSVLPRLNFDLQTNAFRDQLTLSRRSALFGASFLVVNQRNSLRLPETFQGGHWVPLLLSFCLVESTSIRSSAIFAL